MQPHHVLAYVLLAAVVAFLALALWRATRESGGRSRFWRRLRRTHRSHWETINARPASPHRADVDGAS